MISIIKKYIPESLKRILKFQKRFIKTPKSVSPIHDSTDLLGGFVAYNEYGGYFAPLSSRQRPAVQKIMRGDVFEPDTIKFMRDHCGQGDIIHAGTFFGDFLPGISNALSKDNKIWAFEPNLENFRCAQITTLINNLENVELFNFGLGDAKTTAKMLIESESGQILGGGSTIIKNESRGKSIDVEIVRIDDIIPHDRVISIMQLDVEGYEKEALAGALETIKRCKPILILEDNNQIIESSWFTEHISSLGYEINRKIHVNTLLTIKESHHLI